MSTDSLQLTRPDGSPLRVLVVDDEVNIADLISMALRYEGWEVSSAHTGIAAVNAATDAGPDAVVLDTAALGAVPRAELHQPVAHLSDAGAPVQAALDTLFGGY